MKKNFIQKKWVRMDEKKGDAASLSTVTAGLPPAIRSILSQRGLVDEEQIKKFLNPTLMDLPSPFLMKGMKDAVALVYQAMQENSAVVIYGDYDVDGVTGSAVLALFLKEIGLDVTCYQPDRFSKGYGLHADAIRDLHRQVSRKDEEKKHLLISVDCGISNVEEVAVAKERGFSVIIADHHQPPEQLPEADSILNPHQHGCTFPDKDLAGVGVAFYLIMGLRSHLREKGVWQGREAPNLKEYLDLVALGTVCDMVSLSGVNRILVKAGLEVLQHRQRPGLKALADVSGLEAGRKITSEDIGFRLGPRLNAAGRIGASERALELLTTEDYNTSISLANELDAENRKRKELTEDIFHQAAEKAKELIETGRKTLVVSGEGWHPGVLGIVASRLVHQFYRPTIVLSREKETTKGSCRSVSCLNIYEALLECDQLDRFGGHAMAAGVTLQTQNINAFADQFEAYVASQISPDDLVPTLNINMDSSCEELNDTIFLNCYEKLQPFGIGNPEPVFAFRNCTLNKTRLVGTNHMKFTYQENGCRLEGIGFGFGSCIADVSKHAVDLAFALRLNSFNGRETWQANLLDLKVAASP